jgi:hypothetical protein
MLAFLWDRRTQCFSVLECTGIIADRLRRADEETLTRWCTGSVGVVGGLGLVATVAVVEEGDDQEYEEEEAEDCAETDCERGVDGVTGVGDGSWDCGGGGRFDGRGGGGVGCQR